MTKQLFALMPRLWRDRRGLATVELAVLAAALTLLAIGVIDYGQTLVRKTELANAVRAGAQYALIRKPIGGDMSEIRNAVAATAPADKNDSQTITAIPFCECPGAGTIDCSLACADGAERQFFVQITLQETFETLLPYPGIPNSFSLREETIVRLN